MAFLNHHKTLFERQPPVVLQQDNNLIVHFTRKDSCAPFYGTFLALMEAVIYQLLCSVISRRFWALMNEKKLMIPRKIYLHGIIAQPA